MTWFRKHIRAIHSLAVLAMVANIGLALTCCMGMEQTPVSALQAMDMAHGAIDHGATDHASMGHVTADQHQAAAGHEDHGDGGCECMSACMGMAPAVAENSIFVAVPTPQQRLAILPTNDAASHAKLIRSVSARAPPALA